MAKALPNDDDSYSRIGYFTHVVEKEDLKPGDHIYCIRGTYTHHGIYIGEPDCEVIHISSPTNESGLREKISSATVCSCTLKEFRKGCKIRLVAYDVGRLTKKFKYMVSCHVRQAHPPAETVKIAKFYLENPEKFGEYHLIDNNCEAFAKLCKMPDADIKHEGLLSILIKPFSKVQ